MMEGILGILKEYWVFIRLSSVGNYIFFGEILFFVFLIFFSPFVSVVSSYLRPLSLCFHSIIFGEILGLFQSAKPIRFGRDLSNPVGCLQEISVAFLGQVPSRFSLIWALFWEFYLLPSRLLISGLRFAFLRLIGIGKRLNLFG